MLSSFLSFILFLLGVGAVQAPLTKLSCSLTRSFSFFFLPGLGVTNDPQALGPPDHLWFV